MDKSLSDLLDYCKTNNRVCPQRKFWNDLYKILPLNNKNERPPTPLLFGAWWDTPAHLKRLRLLDHIQWAHDNGVLEKVDRYIRILSEDQWYHLND
jgi:hypothetical protein